MVTMTTKSLFAVMCVVGNYVLNTDGKVPYSGKFSRSANFRIFRGCSLIHEIKIQTFQYLEDRRTGINRTQSCSTYTCNAMDATLAS